MSDTGSKQSIFKKHWKVILSFVVIFAILGAAYIAIENFEPKQNTTSEVSEPMIPLLSLDVSLITQIDIENQIDAYTFIRNEGTWIVKSIPTAELHQDRIDSLAYSGATLSAVKCIVTGATDLAPYGLAQPQATVTLSNQNGTAAVFHIGNMTPAGDGYYACLENTKDVYMLATGTAGQFCTDLTSYRVLTLTELNHTQIRAVSIKRQDATIRLTYVAPPEGAYPGSVSTWYMESPLMRPAGSDVVLKQVLSPLSNLIAMAIVEDNPEDLSKYGFSGDSVSVSTDLETITISLGLKDGVYYAMVEGKSAVYLLGTNLPFMSVLPFDLVEKETNLIPIDTVSEIALRLPGVSANLRIETEGETMKFFVNDKPAAEEAFKYRYMEIAGLSVDGIAKANGSKNNGSPEASIVYTMTDGSTVTRTYYPYDSFNYALYENGECTFYIKKTRLTNLAASLQEFIKNPNK